MNERLNQNDLDDLSAWLDGELTGERAAEIERLLKVSPAWQEASRQIRAVGEALDSFTVPAMSAGLAEKIISESTGTGKSWRARIIRIVVPAAAAAAIVLGAVVLYDIVRPKSQNNSQTPIAVVTPDKNKQPDEKFVVQNLDFFADYQTVAHLDLLKAMEGSGSAQKTNPAVSDPAGATVSVETQLELKNKLLAASKGMSSASAMEQNRDQWQKLPSDRQASCKQEAYAFLNASPKRQQELLAGYDELLKLDPQKRAVMAAKAKEVSDIIKTFSQAQLEAFGKATLAEQAGMIEKQKQSLKNK